MFTLVFALHGDCEGVLKAIIVTISVQSRVAVTDLLQNVKLLAVDNI